MKRVLVLHGPNLAKKAAADFNPRLEAAARDHGVRVQILQANGEEGLLDALWQHADSCEGVVVNAGVISERASALAEGLSLCGLRCVEVAGGDGSSLLTAHVEETFIGGADAYVAALEHLAAPLADARQKAAPARPASSAKVQKTIGRTEASRVTEAIRADDPRLKAKGKTIGRAEAPKRTRTESREALMLTRAKVKERIVARLKGKLTSQALAAWARETWTGLQSGGAVEAGAESVLDGVLLELMGAAANNEGALITQMAKLDS
ncbi:MAG: type II 3-dehydroquinate dehydratase [Myxococcaceae bacterium]